MDLRTALEVGGSTVAVVTSVAVSTRYLGRKFARLAQMAEDWQGQPARPEDGVPARPGVMLRLSRLENAMLDVHAQLSPNGGKTIRDAVDRIEAAQSTGGQS